MTGRPTVILRGIPWRFAGRLDDVTVGIGEMDAGAGTAELIIFGSGDTERFRVSTGDEVIIAGTPFRVTDVAIGERGTVQVTSIATG